MVEVRFLDTILSSKIGDTVNDNGDGILFKQSQRIEYIERAFNKTIRLIKLAMQKYAPMFVKRYYIKNFSESDIATGEINFQDDFSTIEQIKVTVTGREENGDYTTIAMRLEEAKYISAQILETRNPSFEDKTIYYSFINDKIVFLPSPNVSYRYTNASILFTADGIKIKSINDKLPIELSYVDLLLSFAAAEAMVDLGRGDKAGVFYDDAYSQIKILQSIAMLKEQKKGTL